MDLRRCCGDGAFQIEILSTSSRVISSPVRHLLLVVGSVLRKNRNRAILRFLITNAVQAGYSYEAIGREEGLTRERIRQIVSQSVHLNRDERLDLPQVQIARLEPALRLTAGAVAKGRVGAIYPLLKILSYIDKYSESVSSTSSEIEGSHERLMAKINQAAGRIMETRRPVEGPGDENLEPGDSEPEPPVTL